MSPPFFIHFRFAFKLAYDQTVLGEASDLDEIVEYLQEYESDWYMGRDTDVEWSEAVESNKPRLFSLIYDTNEVSVANLALLFLCSFFFFPYCNVNNNENQKGYSRKRFTVHHV